MAGRLREDTDVKKNAGFALAACCTPARVEMGANFREKGKKKGDQNKLHADLGRKEGHFKAAKRKEGSGIRNEGGEGMVGLSEEKRKLKKERSWGLIEALLWKENKMRRERQKSFGVRVKHLGRYTKRNQSGATSHVLWDVVARSRCSSPITNIKKRRVGRRGNLTAKE